MTEPASERFLSLFLAAQGDLRAFIGALVRDPSVEEDIFQEISLTLWKNFEKYDATRSFGAWARGVAGRKILEDRRLRARFPQPFPPEVIEVVARGFTADEANGSWLDREHALRICLGKLPENASRLVTGRYGENKSIEAIANDFCLSTDAIYQALSRLRKQLRECIHRRLRGESL